MENLAIFHTNRNPFCAWDSHAPIHVNFTYFSHIPLRNDGEIVLGCLFPEKLIKLVELFINKELSGGRVVIKILQDIILSRGGILVKIVK